MDAATIISIVTLVVTLVLGFLSKKITWINNKMIPLQNLCIGIIASIIYYLMTKDLDLTIVAIGIGTGGAYDLLKSLKELLQGTELYNKLVSKFKKGE